jgi:hypothetical protein
MAMDMEGRRGIHARARRPRRGVIRMTYNYIHRSEKKKGKGKSAALVEQGNLGQVGPDLNSPLRSKKGHEYPQLYS